MSRRGFRFHSFSHYHGRAGPSSGSRPNLTPNDLIALAWLALVGYVAFRFLRTLAARITDLFKKAMPSGPATFRCAHCHREVRHNRRTREALRTGKTALFCPECHRYWLQTHPQPPVQDYSGCEPKRSGCRLPLILVLAALVAAALAAALCLA